VIITILLVISTILASGCAPVSESAEDVAVDLADFSVTLDRDTVPAGPVTFVVRNDGPSVHEIEVFAGATPDQTLPVTQSVADTTGLELVDEMENLLPGSTNQLTVELEPGTYLIICNLPVHYDHGMWATLTVSEG
jgi:uncharacterized cupredoxin-like copper-binding protein